MPVTPNQPTTKLFLLEELDDMSMTRELAQGDLDALRAVADWIKTFVASPHKDLGRPGPVCPFVPRALLRNTLWLAPERVAELSVADVVELLKGYQSLFKDAPPTDGDDAPSKSFVVVFTDLLAERASEFFGDVLEQLAVPSYEADGFVMGSFYEGNEGTAIYNARFRPFTSPVPSLLVRQAVVSDWKFFLDNEDWLNRWTRRYPDAGVQALAEELRRLSWRVARVGLPASSVGTTSPSGPARRHTEPRPQQHCTRAALNPELRTLRWPSQRPDDGGREAGDRLTITKLPPLDGSPRRAPRTLVRTGASKPSSSSSLGPLAHPCPVESMRTQGQTPGVNGCDVQAMASVSTTGPSDRQRGPSGGLDMNSSSSGEAIADAPGSASRAHAESRALTRRTFVGGVTAAGAMLSVAGWAPPVAASGDGPTPRGLGSVSGAPHLPPGFRDVFTSRYVDVGDVRLHAVTGGDGPPLLLVHGWPQTWYQWRLVMPELARHHQVVAVDQRGIGLSDKPQDGYDSASLAGDMVGLMRALGHERFSIYGTDVGMPIAYAVAADHPDRVDRLAVSEAFLPGIAGAAALVFPIQEDPVPNARLWHLVFNQLSPDVNEALVTGREDVFFGAEFDASAGTNKLADEIVRYYVRILRSDRHALHGSFGFYRAMWKTAEQNVQRSTQNQKLSVPVLAMGGEESSGLSVGAIMMAVATDVQPLMIPGAAHWIAEQAPDEVLAALTTFLSG